MRCEGKAWLAFTSAKASAAPRRRPGASGTAMFSSWACATSATVPRASAQAQALIACRSASRRGEWVGKLGVGDEVMVGQRFQKGHQIGFVLGGEVDARNQIALVRVPASIARIGAAG